MKDQELNERLPQLPASCGPRLLAAWRAPQAAELTSARRRVGYRHLPATQGHVPVGVEECTAGIMKV